MKRMIRRKSNVMAARDAQILTFSELTPEQQEKALEIANSNGRLAELLDEWYSDDVMDVYHDQVESLANEFTAQTGIEVNTDKLYWELSSQGPYPEWELKYVFEEYYGKTKNGIEYEMQIYGRGLDIVTWYGTQRKDLDCDNVRLDVYSPDPDDDGEWGLSYEVDCNRESLKECNVDDASIDEIFAKLGATQDFIDKVWSEVNAVCTDYRDDEWTFDMLEANDIEFLVDEDDEVSYYN